MIRGKVDLRALFLSAYYLTFYLCRFNFVPVMPLLLSDFNVAYSQGGLVGSFLFLGYSITLTLAGVMSDIFGAVIIIVMGAFISSISNFLTSMASSFLQLMFLALMNGLGQGMVWPSLMSLTVNMYESEKVDYVIGAMLTAAIVGPPVTFSLIGAVATSYGWRLGFVVPALILIAFTLIFLKIFRGADYPKRRFFRQYNIKQALVNENVWLLGLTYTCFYFIVRGFTSWMPTYFTEKYGMTVMSASLLSGAYLLMNVVGAFAGTWIANVKLKGDKRKVMLVSLFLSSVINAILMLNDRLDIFLLPFLFLSLSLCEWFFFSLVPLITSREFSGTASGIIDALGYLGGFLGTYFIGWFYDLKLSYSSLFLTFFILTSVATFMTFLIKTEASHRSR